MVDRAGFWLRLAALLIDYVAILLVSIGLMQAMLRIGSINENLVGTTPFVIWVVYFATEVLFAATPGKWLCGIIIVRPDGSPADRWTLLTRYLTKHFGPLVGLPAGVTGNPLLHFVSSVSGWIMALGCLRVLGEDRLAWHDLWSHTAVYRRTAPIAAGFPVDGAPARTPPIEGAPPPS